MPLDSGPIRTYEGALKEDKRMELSMGDLVTNRKKPEWGVGEIVAVGKEGRVEVAFRSGGRRFLDLRYADVEVIGRTRGPVHSGPLRLRPDLDSAEVAALCDRFYTEMKDNRRNCNDGRIALKIKTELAERSQLRNSTIRQLAAWCHTEGSVYQRGVQLAREISHALFGVIVPRSY